MTCILLSLLLAASADVDQLRDRVLAVENRANDPIVTSSGSTTPRAVKDRFAESLNAKDWGAHGDGIVDDTAALQAVLDRLTPSYVSTDATPQTITIEAGEYVVTRELSIPANRPRFILKGKGQVTLLWKGPDETSSILRIAGSHGGHIEGIAFAVASGHRASAAINFESYLGQHSLTRVWIDGTFGAHRLDFGIKMTRNRGADANNDHFTFLHVRVENVALDGVLIGHSQSKAHKFYGCFVTHCGRYGVNSVGSFFWYGGATGSNGWGAGTPGADFGLTGVVNNDPIVISGLNSEGSRRLATTGVEPREGASPGNSLPGVSASYPITIEGVRFDTATTPLADGIEHVDGSNPVIKSTPTAKELDGDHGTVGFYYPIISGTAGPVVIRGTRFGSFVSAGRWRRAKILSLASSGQGGVSIEGCEFITDDWQYVPVHSNQRVSLRRNIANIFVKTPGTPPLPGPFSYVNLPDSENAYSAGTWLDGMSHRVADGARFLRNSATPALSDRQASRFFVRLNKTVTSWTIRDGEFEGERIALWWIQANGGGWTVAAPPSNVRLSRGAWIMTSGNGKMDTFTLRWSATLSAWIEESRSSDL